MPPIRPEHKDDAAAFPDNASYVESVHDRGLQYDLRTLSRRSALAAFGGLGLLGLTACGSSSSGSGGTASASGAASSASGASSASSAASSASASSSGSASATGCADEVPEETAGPYPGDGSNGPQVLTESGIVRKDITKSFGSSTTQAAGVPLTVTLTVRDAEACTALTDAAVYLWHCDRDGNYSLYSSGVEDENYLRGVQAADDSGTITFTTIYPGCYAGRWPHIHFEVYESEKAATSGSAPIVKTSQIALPQATSEQVYATDGYSSSVRNLASISLATDNVFRDDEAKLQMATMSGSPAAGYTAALTISV